MDGNGWQLYLETVFTNAADLENYISGNAGAAQDGHVQARLRQLRGESGTYLSVFFADFISLIKLFTYNAVMCKSQCSCFI